jgi:outer membrane protein TolC
MLDHPASRYVSSMIRGSLRYLPVFVVGLVIVFHPSSRLHSQSLDSLVRRAEAAHPSVEAAGLAIREADVRARSASAWEAPRAGVDVRGLAPSNPNPFSMGETMIGLEQAIPLFGQNRAMARAMAIGVQVGEATLDDVRRELRARVEREYYSLWFLDRRSEVNAENRRLAGRLYQSAETRLVTNTGRQSDLLRLRIEIERLEKDVELIRQQRRAALARLNALLVREPEMPVEIPASLTAVALPPEGSLDSGISAHPQLRRMEAMARMSESQAEAEERMLLPMLMLRGGLEYMPEGDALRQGTYPSRSEVSGAMAGEPGEIMRLGITFGAMISIPVAPWSRGGPEDRAEAWRIEGASRLLERDAMRLEMRAMLGTALSDARQAALQLDYYRQGRIPLLERTLESLLSEFTANTTPFARVIDGYRELAMARMDMYMQQMEYAMAVSMIRRLTDIPRDGN